MEYTISLIAGYLVGSVPFAYLLLKKSKGVDITVSGTGNVGAMNAYEVTNSKALGILVLILDLLKGILGVLIPILLFGNEFTNASLGLIGAVFSHCFNPWLSFKGGRGLATSAGGFLLVFPMILFVWLILYAIFFYWKKDIHLGNIAASVLSLIILFNIAELGYKYTYPRTGSANELTLFGAGLFLLILIKHLDPLKEILKNPALFHRKRR